MKNKMADLTELKAELARARSDKNGEKTKTIVMAGGCFDIFHIGHLDYLQTARGMGDILVVAVNSDASVRRIKSRPPVFGAGQRAGIVAALEVVDYVFIFGEDDCCEAIRAIRPDYFVKGWDYKDKTFPEMAAAREIGCEIKIAGEDKKASSSRLRSILRNERGFL
ncbi:adenylyltransferase/cytidyltransferase family protein [Paenibacillus sp. UNC499MF]|uniref:adenylyltransferase/cytidyltransferase family protein n=1 Tax=Paenibacillus sp. UNC499MF TaxID=1502751 RepID=UPI00089FDA80|nr:adenylyltransferase/cytidyltransferase family protein [Paenibacillus sp. UNC499MF]SEF86005.1 rfaE bifunctional protein, domain II [Paenibacillus sp. UNC499MF]